MRSKTLTILAAIVAVLVALLLLFPLAQQVLATEGDEECVPRDAYTETIHHPAVPAVTETIPAVPGSWWNFSPNKKKGPFDGPPAFPTDPRGTWQGPHTNGGPSQDLTGTFQQGKGKGSWFHREAGTPEQIVVITPGKDAYTETIEHPAVVCEEEPPVEEPCPDDSLVLNPETGECEPVPGPEEPEVPTEEPETPEQPETPTDNPSEPPVKPEVPREAPQPRDDQPVERKSVPAVPTSVNAGI